MIPSYLYQVSFPTGSNYICNPPVTDTDIDTMYLVDNLNQVTKSLLNLGWKLCKEEEYPYDHWTALRKDKYNALITDDLHYFTQFYKATEEAKSLNLLKKEDHIALFEKYIPQNKKKKQPTQVVEVEDAFWDDVRDPEPPVLEDARAIDIRIRRAEIDQLRRNRDAQIDFEFNEAVGHFQQQQALAQQLRANEVMNAAMERVAQPAAWRDLLQQIRA
jgi:hypothetical protein